jgi:UDP-glucose 4-epimerase
VKVLVTGAAGYIGSVVTEELIGQGFEVIAIDNLQHGHRRAVHPKALFVKGDLLDGAWLKSFLLANPCDAVVHLAAEALIDESLRDPGRFFRANICGGVNLLEAMVAAGTEQIVFSSTAAVYGEPKETPITEDSPCTPVNSYGESKLAFERILGWYRRAYGLKYVSLRYFNAAGATERCGECHIPETHLIPILLEVTLGQRDALYLYGTDYDTPNGTCIRDYIHVVDIGLAHLLALKEIGRLEAATYNMGNGSGYSNLEVIDTVRFVTGREIKVICTDRRPGDPARLVASSERIRRELGWKPRYSDLNSIVETAWAWRQEHPQGYAA